MFDDEILQRAEKIVHGCRARSWTVVTAESCTGGLVVGALTAIPGSSNVIDRSFVTYSARSKSDLLGIELATIERDGVVSEAIARAMAKGALRVGDPRAELSVAVTGVAGPGSNGPREPEGLVHIAAERRSGTQLHTRLDLGPAGRDYVRGAAVTAALTLLLQLLDAP